MSSAESVGVTWEDTPEGVRVATLSNPAKRNALNEDLLRQLARCLPAGGSGVRALLLRGAGGHFSSGYDLSSLSHPTGSELPDDYLGEVLRAVEECSVPIVAVMEGAVFGAGCELACACDFRIASLGAVLCMPPAKLGVVYAPEGIGRVAALVGLSRAKWIFLTGRKVDAATALNWGLFDEVGPDPAASALQLCRELAANAPLAVSGMKQAVRLLAQTRLSAEEVSELRELRRRVFQSEDVQEGRAAFLAKRRPTFKGV